MFRSDQWQVSPVERHGQTRLSPAGPAASQSWRCCAGPDQSLPPVRGRDHRQGPGGQPRACPGLRPGGGSRWERYLAIVRQTKDDISQFCYLSLGKPIEVHGWDDGLKLGQVSAVDVDLNDDPVIFHRGPLVWDAQTFDSKNVLKKRWLRDRAY